MEEEDHKQVMATLKKSGIFGTKMLDKCSAVLLKNDIDEECLLGMTRDELHEIFTFGMMKKIMKWQISIRGEPEPVAKQRVKPPPQLLGKRRPPLPVLQNPINKEKMSPAPEPSAKRFPASLSSSKIRKKSNPKCLPLPLLSTNGSKEKPSKPTTCDAERREGPLSFSDHGMLNPVPPVSSEPDINVEELKIPKKAPEMKTQLVSDQTADEVDRESRSSGGRKRRQTHEYEDRTQYEEDRPRSKLRRQRSRSRSRSRRRRNQASRSRLRRLDHARRLYNQKTTSEDDIPISEEECKALFEKLAQDFQVEYGFIKTLYGSLEEQSRTLFVSGFDIGTNADQADELLSKILLSEDIYEDEPNQNQKVFEPDALVAEIESVKEFAAQSCLVFFKSRHALRAVERIIKRHGLRLALCATMFRKRPKDLTTEERDADPSLLSYLKRLLGIPKNDSRYKKRPRDDVRFTGNRRKSNSSGTWDKKARRSPSSRRRAIGRRKDADVHPEIFERGSPRYRRSLTRGENRPSRNHREQPNDNQRYRASRRNLDLSPERLMSPDEKLLGHETYLRRNRSPRSRSRGSRGSRGQSRRKNKGHSHRPTSRPSKPKNNKILRCSVCSLDFIGSYDFNKHLDEFGHRKDKEFY